MKKFLIILIYLLIVGSISLLFFVQYDEYGKISGVLNAWIFVIGILSVVINMGLTIIYYIVLFNSNYKYDIDTKLNFWLAFIPYYMFFKVNIPDDLLKNLIAYYKKLK